MKIGGYRKHRIQYKPSDIMKRACCRILITEGNFRLYSNKAFKELEFVKHCRSLDIPLNDIKRLIELKQARGDLINMQMH